MRMLLLVTLAVMTIGLGAQSDGPRMTNLVFDLADGTKMTYGLSRPANVGDDGTSPDGPRPLVLALHPGGSRPYYGTSFMQGIVEPGLREWNAIIVAPDVPAQRWSNERSEEAVLALLADVMSTHEIDTERVLVTGFSMGGRGTWYFATRHSDLFTGAIAMAARRGEDDDLDGLGSMPIQLIHSPSDEVVPFAPAEDIARELAARNHPSGLIAVPGAGHYNMGNYVPPLAEAAAWMWNQWDDK